MRLFTDQLLYLNKVLEVVKKSRRKNKFFNAIPKYPRANRGIFHFAKKFSSNFYPQTNPGYKVYVFHIRHHRYFSSAQPIKEKFEFRPVGPVATSIFGGAFLLTNENFSISSYGQRQFNLI